jgi:hypothetical protein
LLTGAIPVTGAGLREPEPLADEPPTIPIDLATIDAVPLRRTALLEVESTIRPQFGTERVPEPDRLISDPDVFSV